MVNGYAAVSQARHVDTSLTDATFTAREKGKLLMIWSSFGKDGYAIGIAESATGSVKDMDPT